MSMWVRVDVGHVIQVTAGAHILLKDGFIPYLRCPSIENHVASLLLPAVPGNLRINLPALRAYVREHIAQNSSYGQLFHC